VGEDSKQPSAETLLKVLHRQMEQLGSNVRFHDVSPVKQASTKLASLLEPRPERADAESVLQVLTEASRKQTAAVRFHDVGTVLRIGDAVATLSGLRHASTYGLVNFPTGVQGLILDLEQNLVDVILLGPEEGIQGGDLVTTANERLQVPVGQNLLGRIVDPLGKPLDGGGPVVPGELRYLERDAPAIIERAAVDQPLHTGLKVVDALVPIGRGQRELILGDRQTGKTALGIDAILNQRDSDVLCVYVAIGQKKSSTTATLQTLRDGNAMPHTIVVVSGPDDPPALRYLAPYAGCTMAEFLMDQGRDVLIVYDDLTKHASAYRELSLLLRRPPGREAYPGDIFYLHARLLERACKLNEANGGGSLTALPIAEMQRGNVAAYIPTNLIAINDGQIVVDAALFNRGTKPAVDVGRSVSRVGGRAQTTAMRAVAGRLRLELSQYEEVARFARFGTEVDEATRRQIRRGQRLRAALTQPVHQPLPLASQVAILHAATEGHLDDLMPEAVPAFESGLLAHLEAEHPGLLRQLNRGGDLTDEIRGVLLESTANHQATDLTGADPGAATEGETP
jgi:F-type H+-transporting ATPase subunit alpha